MYANVFIKLSIFYVTVSITQAASIDLCLTIRNNLNKDFQYPAERDTNTNRLLLRDCPSFPFFENAVDDIRSFIVDKLDLPHLEWQILQATYTDKGLLFEMSLPKYAEEILDQFHVKLRHKDCVLKTTLKEFFH